MLKKLAGPLATIAVRLPIVLRDLVGLAAVGLISYGAWLVVPAAGYIVCGVLLLAGTILISAKAA
ncbi:hypothetical protein NKH69_00205 [Mesorhizobium sp. M0976]|uniref:hypothetical protein n=1 Tax=Mesorhizobium sp. M0976 TaxID=2957038 RepID=UPI00333675BE